MTATTETITCVEVWLFRANERFADALSLYDGERFASCAMLGHQSAEASLRALHCRVYGDSAQPTNQANLKRVFAALPDSVRDAVEVPRRSLAFLSHQALSRHHPDNVTVDLELAGTEVKKARASKSLEVSEQVLEAVERYLGAAVEGRVHQLRVELNNPGRHGAPATPKAG